MKEYRVIAEMPKNEKVVSTTQYGGFNYWNAKFPFHHYKEPRFLVATESAIYEIISN